MELLSAERNTAVTFSEMELRPRGSRCWPGRGWRSLIAGGQRTAPPTLIGCGWCAGGAGRGAIAFEFGVVVTYSVGGGASISTWVRKCNKSEKNADFKGFSF